MAASPPWAQDARGAITGRVADSSGGVLPGVSVTVVNTATNAADHVVTNDTGDYTALYLLPGDLHGDRDARRLQDASSRATSWSASATASSVDITLEPGGVEEEVIVVDARPVLETGTATMGQVIDAS